LFFNAAGGIVWALVFGIGAFVFGDSIHRVSGPLGVLGLVGVVAGGIAIVYIVRREERKMEKKFSRSDVDRHTLP
jgi:membrane protein DedA with SNARE-associated domain